MLTPDTRRRRAKRTVARLGRLPRVAGWIVPGPRPSADGRVRAAVAGPGRYDADVKAASPLPRQIAGIPVPQDDVSRAAWQWAGRSLPRYLFGHSVRVFFWGAAIAAGEGWTFDRRVLWTASLMHDLGLTRLPRNTMCFEVEGAEFARRFLERRGLPADDADRVAIAIILHMRASVTLSDGVESVLLDRATGLDVRGAGYGLVSTVLRDVLRAFPRDGFDRRFFDAIRREAAARPHCQSAQLLRGTGLADWMTGSPWAHLDAQPESGR